MQQRLLSGEYEHTLDGKGRVTLPARYREHFRHGVVLVRFLDSEPCVRVYHPEAWEEFDGKYLEPLDEFGDEEASWKIRDVYRNLVEAEPDKQGRVRVPSQFVEELGLKGKVKIVGRRNGLEIWNPETLALRDEERRQGNDS